MYSFLFMVLEEITTRLFNIRGETVITTAYSNKNETFQVKNGRCLYLVRLEVANQKHPEITENECYFDILTTYAGVTGSGHRREGDVMTFEQLVSKHSKIPIARCLQSDKYRYNCLSSEPELSTIFEGYVFNIHARILSEFDGYRQAFAAHHDEGRTYTSVILRACREVLPMLKK